MTAIENRFNPEILHSYGRLQNFLVGPEADDKVRRQLLDTRQESSSDSICYSVFLKLTGCLLYYTGFVRKGLELDARAEEIMSRIETLEKHGSDCIVTTLNMYSDEAFQLFPLGKIPVRKIQDPELQKVVLPKGGVMQFDDPAGMCRGESAWFIRAYLKTNALFATKRMHLEALGKLFRKGAPIEAALVQDTGLSNHFLQLKTTQTIYLTNPEPISQPMSYARFSQLVNTFKNLEAGVYNLDVPKHAMVYVSIGDGTGYFFNPSFGVFFIHDDAGFRKLGEEIVRYQKKNQQAFVDYMPARHKNYARELLVTINKVELL